MDEFLFSITILCFFFFVKKTTNFHFPFFFCIIEYKINRKFLEIK